MEPPRLLETALRLRRLAGRATAVVLLVGTAACVTNPERLPRLDRQFYANLAEDDQLPFLKLKESERQAFLESRGLWSQWVALSAKEREAVETREVHPGYHAFAAHMAFGPPADSRVAEARGRVVRFETFIRCTSGPRAGEFVLQNLDCDGTSAEIQLAIEEDRVTEVKFLD